MRDIETCRTAVLGGHLDVCDACGDARPAYNSCRNRHCPKCQCLRQAKWVADRMERVLPTHHFHVVFTVPEECKPLALRNRIRFFEILFASASHTLLQLGLDPDRCGATLGITAVLHTWTRKLGFHPHLHCIVTGGGLAPDGARWISVKGDGNFLFPVAVIGALFRGKLLAALTRAREHGQLDFDGECADLADPAAFARWKDALYKKNWVVYCKPPFGGAEQVFKYLGRYTHRVGISNQRLRSFDERGVTFATKDGAAVTLAPHEFIRRFLLHVLPRGFVRIRLLRPILGIQCGHAGLVSVSLGCGERAGPRARPAWSNRTAVQPAREDHHDLHGLRGWRDPLPDRQGQEGRRRPPGRPPLRGIPVDRPAEPGRDRQGGHVHRGRGMQRRHGGGAQPGARLRRERQ